MLIHPRDTLRQTIVVQPHLGRYKVAPCFYERSYFSELRDLEQLGYLDNLHGHLRHGVTNQIAHLHQSGYRGGLFGRRQRQSKLQHAPVSGCADYYYFLVTSFADYVAILEECIMSVSLADCATTCSEGTLVVTTCTHCECSNTYTGSVISDDGTPVRYDTDRDRFRQPTATAWA